MLENDTTQTEQKTPHKKPVTLMAAFQLTVLILLVLYTYNVVMRAITEATDENSAVSTIAKVMLNEFAATLEPQELDFYSVIPAEYVGDTIKFVVASHASSDLYTIKYPYFLHGQDKDKIKYAKSETGYNYISFSYNPADIVYDGRKYPEGAYNVTIYLHN